ncbi:MAG TPA: lipopolysaccharide biosynthesis protein [Terracidiphilus sp.]|jgi:PST family polysaccharide transporter|nr:lipopolysaccharide biosynthesis protein [Terracidiphilus sp.]
MTHEPRSIAASALAGIRWNIVGGAVASLCSLTIGIVLARMLGPKPYGQVILASTLYGFAQLFVDGGFSQALIQKAAVSEQEVRRTFTVQIACAVATTCLVSLCASWIARRVGDPSVAHVIQAMSWTIILQSFGLVSAALLRRQMRFRILQYAALGSYLCGYLFIGIPLARAGAGVWSLVAACLCQSLLNAILLYAAVRHSVMPSIGLPERSTSVFGGTIIASNLVNWGHANLDNLAAAQLGPIALGLYGRACNFAYQPVNAAVTALQSVLMSSTARAQQQHERVRSLALSAMAIVFGILACAYAVLALMPETTIAGLFGDKWLAVIPLMVPLALAMPIYGVHCLLGPIVCGLGKPALEFWPQAISCCLALAAFFAAARFSILAVAWTLLGITLIRFGLTASFAFRLLHISWSRVLPLLAKRAAFAAAFGGLAWTADQILRVPFHLAPGPRLLLVSLLCATLLGVTIWSAGELIFGRDALTFLRAYAQHLPPRYARQIRVQMPPRPSHVAAQSSPTGVAG